MTEYQYDPIGRVRKVYDNGKVLASYDYNADNTIRKIRFANGITTEYTYDKDKNKASIKTVTAEGNVLMDYHYEYDRNGNLTARIGGVGLTRPDKTSYTYDSLQRISNVTYGDGVSESFTYDQVGNRIKRTLKDREEVYNYDTRNRLLDRTIHDLINPQDSHITTYEYDKQGNTLREVTRYLDKNDDVINTKIYEYNAFQKVSKITVASANQAEVQENFYDPEGLRYGVRENGRYTGFITNGWYVLGEIDEEWNIRKRLVRGHDIVASEDYDKVSDTSAYHFYHQNEHYDMELITGHDGRIRNSYSYDVFGNLRTSEEGIENRYTYYGEQYDKVSEQYYLRARYYNPAIARFTQEDEYRGDGLNLYAYCANNPIMYVDPSGYSDKPCTGKKQNDDAPDNNGGPNNGTPNNEGGSEANITQVSKKTTGGQKKGSDTLPDNLVQRGVTPEQAEAIAKGNGIEKPKPSHNTTPTQHVGGAPHSRDPWTSTSRSSETAEYYATHDANGNLMPKPNPVVEIDLNKIDPQNIVDVSTPEKAKQLTRPFCQNAAAYDQEVLIKGDIPADAITKIIYLEY